MTRLRRAIGMMKMAVNRVDRFGRTLLHTSAKTFGVREVKLALDCGASVNKRDLKGNTALKLACGGKYDNARRLKVVKVLLKSKGANLNMRDKTAGHTALMVAAKRGHWAVVRALVAADASLDIRDNDGNTALCVAANEGQCSVAKLLVDNNAFVDSRNAVGASALIRAAAKGHIGVVTMLLQAGADPSFKEYGTLHTALTRSAGRGHLDIVKLLILHGARLTSHSYGCDALTAACSSHQREVAQYLASKGAAVNGHLGYVYKQWDAFMVLAVTTGRVQYLLWRRRRNWVLLVAACCRALHRSKLIVLMAKLHYSGVDKYIGRFL